MTCFWQVSALNLIRESDLSQGRIITVPVRFCTATEEILRLTAPDGYQAQRSYSIASEPERSGEIDLTIEKIADGVYYATATGTMVTGSNNVRPLEEDNRVAVGMCRRLVDEFQRLAVE